MIINHNLNAMNAHRNMGINNTASGKAMEKLSSGLRINRAGDDAAGLAISEKMRGQIRGLDQASRNSQDGISLIQTAEGALNETHSILQRMRELVVQSGNEGTQEDTDLQAIQDEINELNDELTGIANRTAFNGKSLLQGNYEGKIQIGANANQVLDLTINSGNKLDADGDPVQDADGNDVMLGFSAEDLGVSAVDVNPATAPVAGAPSTHDANLALVDAAIASTSAARSKLGANQNRLEHTIANLNNASENLTAAESRIRDVDMAKEMMNFSKNNILNQAAQAMLAQANQQPQNVLQLLK
ncbi:flagellin Hag [Alloiococcus sp. CFN-8]|uniref:flagellin Hag n=1 Tax=Alloiococcus sp. CFN-8 TaxID=3416081 RepID=UPI003CE7FBA9